MIILIVLFIFAAICLYNKKKLLKVKSDQIDETLRKLKMYILTEDDFLKNDDSLDVEEQTEQNSSSRSEEEIMINDHLPRNKNNVKMVLEEENNNNLHKLTEEEEKSVKNNLKKPKKDKKPKKNSKKLQFNRNFSTQNNNTQPLLDPKKDSCPICLEEYKIDDKIIQLNCSTKHFFHVECLKEWVFSGTGMNAKTCPLCNSAVVDEQNSDKKKKMIESEHLLIV